MPIRLTGGEVEWRGALGAGTSASVWLVARGDQTYALKLGQLTERDRLASEAERLLLAASARLPKLIEVGELSGSFSAPGHAPWPAGAPYLLLNHVAGQALAPVTDAPAAEQLACAVLRDVGAALADLHAAGFAHGDVKPDNIQVSSDQRCTLLDLGLSDALGQELPRGATPRYLPPELLQQGNGGDGRTRDMWALGVCALEVLTPGLDVTHPWPQLASVRGPLRPILSALLRKHPFARPQAAWVSRAAGADTSSQPERWQLQVRQSYLAQHARQLLRVARGYPFVIQVEGPAGQWLQHACEQLTRIARLRGVRPLSTAECLAPLGVVGQRRWLLKLIGLNTVDFPALPAQTDSALAQLLLQRAQVQSPESLTYGMLFLQHANDAAPLAGDAVDIALLLGSESPSAQALNSAEALVLRGDANPVLSLALARALKRRHAMPRALAVLDQLHSPEAKLESANIMARLGDSAEARAYLDQALQHAPSTSAVYADAHALHSRLYLQQGQTQQAQQALQGVAPTLRVLEAHTSLALTQGQLTAAKATLHQALGLQKNAEDQARSEALFANLEQQLGDSAQALQRYRKAAEHAARAGAVLEEATYLVGVASTATNLGQLSVALAAAERSALLFEYIERPDAAARALLSKANVLCAVGAYHAAEEAAELSRRLAKQAADRRCQAFAHLLLCEVTEPNKAAEHLQRASSLLSPVREDDAVQLAALQLRLGQLAEPATFDAQVRRDLPADSRLSWWGMRARFALLHEPAERAEPLLDELCSLVHVNASVVYQGPAFAYGAQLAARAGDGERTRILATASGAALRTLTTDLSPELKLGLLQLDWAKQVTAPPTASVSQEQVGDIETLIHSLSERNHLRALLDRSLDALVRWTSVERGLLLLTAPGGRLQVRAARNLARRDLSADQLQLSMSLAERALQTRECVVAMDATGELPSAHVSVHALKLRSVLAVPLLARGEVMGVAYLDDRMRSGAFGRRELGWVRLVATLVAVAIADARDQLLLRRAARRARKAEERVMLTLAQRETALYVATQELARTRARTTRYDYEQIVGQSPVMQSLLQLVDRVVPSDIPVLVRGPSGSGKELIARAIHFNGPRAHSAFVSENCSAIPESLLESTLFGHVKGAFTGAARHHAGLFEVAHGGTLFLDEIADMSLGMQGKLLRALENGEIRRVGSEKTQKVDVRVIGATHKDLEQLVSTKLFREDLYYRLNVITLHLPALQERIEDIPLLVRHFLQKCAPGRSVALGAGVMDALLGYTWPGNVRQLENELRRALVLADDEIRREHLSPSLKHKPDAPHSAALNLRQRLDALESELVRRALEQTGGNQTKAAQLLGVSRFGLQKMIRRLGIQLSDVIQESAD